MSKSIIRRLSAQIPLEQQPEFLAGTFDADVLRKALKIIEPDLIDLESIAIRHECCLLSKTTLFPPHNAGKNWTLALDDDGAEVEIEYCPWCGIKLPTAKS